MTTLANATFKTLSIKIDGTTAAYAYVDGVYVATISTNLPDTQALCVTLQIVNGAAAIKNMKIDYVLVVQER